MFALASKNTTFLAYLTLILAAAAVEAHSPLEQRGHAQLKRIIKKRAPQIFGDNSGPIIGPIGAAPIQEADSLSASVDPSGSSASVSASMSVSASASASVSASVSGSASLSASSSVSGSLSASTESSASASASASESSAVSSTTEEAPQITEAPAGPTFIERSTSTRQASTRVITTSVEAAEESAPPSMAGAAQSDQNKSNIATILIAVVASVGGVFILWTIFRKWKLGSSKKFDRRMQPIDWEKSDVHHRRQSDSSFQSAGHHSSRGSPTHALPDHDFTAGPAHLSPVGGYADMSRVGRY